MSVGGGKLAPDRDLLAFIEADGRDFYEEMLGHQFLAVQIDGSPYGTLRYRVDRGIDAVEAVMAPCGW